MSEKKSFLLRASEIAEKEATFSHPWNLNSLISGTQMSRLVGLARVGVSLAKIPPGKESFIKILGLKPRPSRTALQKTC
jgi:uncharacterized cupin superfamily protein